MAKLCLLLFAIVISNITAFAQQSSVLWEGDRSPGVVQIQNEPDSLRNRFYISAFGGLNAAQSGNELDPSPATYGPSKTYFEQSSQIGWLAGIKAGHVWYTGTGLEPALEIESFYGSVPFRGENGFKKLTPRSREWLAKRGLTYPDILDGSRFDANTGGQITSIHVMGNLILRAQMGRFRPYVGVGGGVAKVEQHGLWMRLNRGKETLVLPKDGGLVPAVQGIAGVEYLMGEKQNWGIFAEYKPLAHFNRQNFGDVYLQHLIVMGLKYYF